MNGIFFRGGGVKAFYYYRGCSIPSPLGTIVFTYPGPGGGREGGGSDHSLCLRF